VPESALVLPQVATISRPIQEMCRHVVRMLLELLAGRGARTRAHALLTLPERPTAVFAANDLSAIRTMQVAQRLGLDVPGDVSVIGFDNVPESVLASPALTTIAQPIQEMGRHAVRMLLELLSGRELDMTHVTLPTELIVRQSCGPAPTSIVAPLV